MHRRPSTFGALGATVVLLAAACSGGGDDAAGTPAADAPPTATSTAAPPQSQPPPSQPVVFNGQGNDLVAYSTQPPFERQVVIRNAADDPEEGLDINGQICFDPADPRRFVAGEDTGQPDPPAGWGVFELSGTGVGEFEAERIGKLTPTYQPADDQPENYGCGFLRDGRIVTVDIGNQAAGDPTGQLIAWFPPFDSTDVAYCKLDVTLPTGQGMLVAGDDVYVAAARGAAVFRYDVSTFPSGPRARDGCDGRDGTGAPLATGVTRAVFIEAGAGNSLATPNAIARGPDGSLYVSSVLNGVIAEFRADGTYVRDVLRPPADERLGERPFSTGTPLGLGVAADGTIYYADLGIVISPDGVGPGDRTGAVRRIRFAGGEPRPPEVVDRGLAFPDGIGIWPP